MKKGIFATLIFIRLGTALFSPSYIHPDEYFQNGEVAASDVFAASNITSTWEWTGEQPIRSIVPVWITTGLPFYICSKLSMMVYEQEPSAYMLFLAQRLSFCLLSLFLDFSISILCPQNNVASYLLSLCGVMFTFVLHPFSNSVEAVLVALGLVLLNQINKTKSNYLCTFLLGCCTCLGIWTRITFLSFGVIVGLGTFWTVLKQNNRMISKDVLLHMSVLLVSCILSALSLVAIDSWYFGKFAITPWNSYLYNRDPLMVAQHGIHPLWLHICVNMPMLYGPFLFIKVTRISDFVSLCSFFYTIVTLALLSTSPHQEPRFLTSLLVPMVVLASKSFPRPTRHKRLLLVLFFIHSLSMLVVYGFLHQGGLSSTLISLNSQLLQTNSTLHQYCSEGLEIIFWKTFMPPLHLILPLNYNDYCAMNLTITDFSGSSLDHVLQQLKLTSEIPHKIVVTPVYNYESLPTNFKDVVPTLLFTKGIHVDFDDLGEIFNSGIENAKLGVWYMYSNI